MVSSTLSKVSAEKGIGVDDNTVWHAINGSKNDATTDAEIVSE
jgi:hypothetical protein